MAGKSQRIKPLRCYCYWILIGLALIGKDTIASPHDYDRPISAIDIYGNDKTQSRFILKWSKLYPGQILNRQLLAAARQNLLDTSLFKRVKLQAITEGEQVRVQVNVKEKNFNLILPRLGRNSNGDIKTGLKLRMYNIAGADQSMSLLVEKTDLSTGEENQRFRLNYKFPQYSKPYYYRWRISQSAKNTNDNDFENTEFSDSISFSVARDLHADFSKQPITINTGFSFNRVELDQPYPQEFDDLEEGDFSAFGLELEFDDIHQQRFRRFGRYLSIGYQQGLSELNSDYLSRIFKIEWLRLIPRNAHDNFNSRVYFGLSRDSPFDAPYFDLGGADNVRGLARDFISGDVLVFANFEYVFGYQNHPTFRNSLFIDVGNVYPDSNSIELDELYATLGVGLRWKLTSFIKTDLFIDIAYDPDSEETRGYAGTSLHF